MGKKAIVVGANGMVGETLYHQLASSKYYDEIVLITRRHIDVELPNVVSEVIDFNKIHNYWDVIHCDDLYYCLGTTRNKTKNFNEFVKVEMDYCINIANIAKHSKVSKFLYVSSSGASAKSIFKYLKTKGQIEAKLIEIGFPTLHIFRPYVLMGARKEFRFFESITKVFLKIVNFMMIGFFKNFKGMPDSLLSKAMIHFATKEKKGIFIHSNREIHELFPKKKK